MWADYSTDNKIQRFGKIIYECRVINSIKHNEIQDSILHLQNTSCTIKQVLTIQLDVEWHSRGPRFDPA